MPKRTGITLNKTALRISNPRLLPLKDAAHWLGLTIWAMRERIWAGQIPVVQFPGGRKQYIDVQDLEAFIQNNKRTID
jgi:hypothetical protein